MPVVPDMESFLGKNINSICKNRFHDPAMNHCAHFVCHAMGFDFSFNCQDYKGGNKPAANIRVHEVFANCPRVGKWSDADTSRSQLIFVTRTNVVNIAAGTMQNIPQKHIGIYHNGHVYHYSNTNDQVVKQTVPAFFARFQAAYSGTQGLFFCFNKDGKVLWQRDFGTGSPIGAQEPPVPIRQIRTRLYWYPHGDR